MLLGGKVISSSTNTCPYRAYIETLLNYSKEEKNTQLGMDCSTMIQQVILMSWIQHLLMQASTKDMNLES